MIVPMGRLPAPPLFSTLKAYLLLCRTRWTSHERLLGSRNALSAIQENRDRKYRRDDDEGNKTRPANGPDNREEKQESEHGAYCGVPFARRSPRHILAVKCFDRINGLSRLPLSSQPSGSIVKQ